MIKKLRIDELEKGMYVSGFQKDRSDKALFFMNNLLIKDDEELKEFYDYGYRSAYVLVDDPVDSKLDTAEAGHERAEGVKEPLKGIEEYAAAGRDANQGERAEGEHGPGPAKIGMEPAETENARAYTEAAPPPPGATEPEAAPPGIETKFIGAAGVEAARPDTDNIEAASTETETALIGTAGAEAAKSDTGDAEAASTETKTALIGTAGAEAAKPDTGDAETASTETETALIGTAGAEAAKPDTDDAEAASTETETALIGTAGEETAKPDTGGVETSSTETETAGSDLETASPKEPGEESTSQTGPDSSPSQTDPDEAPVRHIRLLDKPQESTPEKPPTVEVAEDTVDYKTEIEEATRCRDDAEVLVREFMHDKQGELKPERVHQAVEQMVDSIFRNRDALSSLVRLKSADDYTFGHCVNVCILSMALSRQMGFTKKTAHDLGVGAVLHDIGKTLIKEKTLKKPGPLSDIELGEIRTHPELGAKLLLDADGIKDESKHVVVQHHEKYNGTGYPHRKEGERIHIFARIAAVADVYDAMTSTRVYQQSLPPDIVLQKMYMWREAHFEPNIVERLIKCLGIYPIGTLVELNTGEIAVVTATNPNNPIKPGILVLFDEDKIRIPKPIEVHLNSEMTRWVVESKDPRRFGVDVEDIIA